MLCSLDNQLGVYWSHIPVTGKCEGIKTHPCITFTYELKRKEISQTGGAKAAIVIYFQNLNFAPFNSTAQDKTGEIFITI